MFETLKKLVDARFTELQKYRKLMVVDYDRDVIWSAYLDNFSEETRQGHNCNCCKSFIRQVGGVVAIDPDTLLTETLWNLDMKQMPEEFRKSVAALHDYVLRLPIKGLFMHPEPSAGVDKNLDKVRNVVWQHFHVKIPSVIHDKRGELPSLSGAFRTTKEVFKRALDEITPEAIDMVLEAIGQGTIYRGPEYEAQVRNLKTWQEKYREIPAGGRDNFCWLAASEMTPAFATVRNNVIGTLLVDLSEGRDFDSALRSFEQKNAPANYQRPKAAVTPKMIENAKKRLEELGLTSALQRRRLDTRDLTANNTLFAYRPKKATKDAFAQLAGDTPVDVKTLSKVEEVSIEDFVKKVLPTAKALRVLVEGPHLSKLVTLTGAEDPEAGNPFKWDNSFGWSYSGGFADAIKDRVKAAGGNVSGWMRMSLAWYNWDDLDLHMVYEGGKEHIYHGSKRGSIVPASLDVDMRGGHGATRTPVENIIATRQMPAGAYEVWVHNYRLNELRDTGFELEIEHDGNVRTYSSPRSPGQSKQEVVKFTVAGNGTVAFEDSKLSSTSSGAVKWGITTGRWQQVRAVTLSPNYWTKPEGPKHYFFLLEGCVSDEKTVPFLNEFLCQDLRKDSKVTEALLKVLEVSPAEGVELSGLGFSETVRSHIHVEVEGAFKRVVKVNF